MGRKGFGLIEVLVLLLIVAILAAMMMPALSRARSAAKSTGGRPAVPAVPAEPWQTSGVSEELWVIERSDEQPAEGAQEPLPGQGELRVKGHAKELSLPLEHTDVKASVSAFISSVHVTQVYSNPYSTKIEAVYVFPLPQSAAVTDFLLVVGDRRVRGVIREREEARRIYEEARARGYVASLLTQERPNVFTQSVANIEPGRKVEVRISYFNPLPYRDGEYEFVFPMVVGPRFNPPGFTEGIGAVAAGQRGISGQRTEVQYLTPGTRSTHDISLAVDIDAGVRIKDVTSPTHAIRVERKSPERVTVSLSPSDSAPNKDFVLRYRTAEESLKAALLTHRGEAGNTFALLLQPPAGLQDVPRMRREMVFVLDCSGSMSGKPLAKAKEAARRAIQQLSPEDTFQIIRFSERSSQFGRTPVPATPGNVKRGLAYLDGLRAEGGTMMIEGIKAALQFPHDEGRLRIVSFMTDGYIGNEDEILAAIKQTLGDSRIFSFGVGSSVNRYLLEQMARVGRGAVAFVGLQEGTGRAVDQFYERAARPALTDVAVDWGPMRVSDVYPRQIPDVLVGRPVLVTGRFEGQGRGVVRVSGRAGEQPMSVEINVALDERGEQHAGLEKVWARWAIADLSDRMTGNPSEQLQSQITKLSLQHSLLSAYTAFVAVDDAHRTGGDHGVTVAVPVPVPEGVRYETTVQTR